MRKSEREIKEFADIADVISRADTVRLGIKNEPYPYVVPLSYGFEVKNNRMFIYIHGAKEGFKHDLLARDNRVCAEFDIFNRYAPIEKSVTTEYESVIGFGEAICADYDESIHGLNLILAHCGYEGFEYSDAAVNFTKVYRIELLEITGKRRFVK